jgi:hypothetical protein
LYSKTGAETPWKPSLAVLWGQPLIYLPHSKQNPTSAPMLMGFNIFSMFFISVKLVGIVAPSLQLTTT